MVFVVCAFLGRPDDERRCIDSKQNLLQADTTPFIVSSGDSGLKYLEDEPVPGLGIFEAAAGGCGGL
jgi:hypothetical protein